MAASEISRKSFFSTLVCFSNWYDQRHLIRKLKVLYRGYISEAALDNASTTLDLLNMLHASGDLSSTDLTILYDTIKATKQFGIVDKLRKHIPSFPNVKDIIISKFSHHQQKILDLGNVLSKIDVNKIDRGYNDPPKNYQDAWSLLRDLQFKQIICEEKEKMDEFIETLKCLKLHRAVDILTKDIKRKSDVVEEYLKGLYLLGFLAVIYQYLTEVSDGDKNPVATGKTKQEFKLAEVKEIALFIFRVTVIYLLVTHLILIFFASVFLVKTDFNAVDKITAVMDSAGGTLYLKDEDIKLVINPGSIEEGKKVEISLENIWDKTSYPELNEFETIVSPVVRCRPPGTVFKKHSILSFPYNAVNEESWEFTLLVKESFQDKWRRIKLGSDDKDIHFYLHNGRCVVNLIHFTDLKLGGERKNDNGRKHIPFSVYGKMHLNKYQLRVRTWNSQSKKMVREEAEEFGEILVEVTIYINLLFEDLVVRVLDVNNGWKINETAQTEILRAEDFWNDIPSWRLFKFTRSDPPSDVLRAKMSFSQNKSNLRELDISCETRQENKIQEVFFSSFISALTVVVVGLIIAWKFQAFLTSHSEIALFSGLIVALITFSIMLKLVKSATPVQTVACVFLNIFLYYLSVWMYFGFAHPLTRVHITIIVSVFIIAFLVAVVLFGEDVLKFVPFIGIPSTVMVMKLLS